MTTSPIPARLARLRVALGEADVDALLVSQPENRRYLSGFTGSAGWLLLTADTALLATDFRYFEQVGLESPSFELLPVERAFADVLPAMLAQAGVQRLGFEADFVTFADVQTWSKAAPEVVWTPTKGLVMGLRAVKEAAEIAALRAAIQLADAALGAALAQTHAGMTERDLAWAIESYVRTHGAEAVSFDTIVAGGPNGARPHARATDARLPVGAPIVIDMGARLNGYCSDITRTVCLGEPADPGRFWEVYHTVLRAQQAAEAALRPGMTGQEADAVAREIIAEADYGSYFGHNLGHGVGLAVHEEPRLGRTNPAGLVPGNVVTVEPGIYLPGWGGVRIEDIVLITESGAEVLTAAPKGALVG